MYYCYIQVFQQGPRRRFGGVIKSIFQIVSSLVVNDYSSRAFAWAGKAERAETLLEEMNSDYLDGNDSSKPNVRSFNTLLDAWSKSRYRDSSQRPEAILERMVNSRFENCIQM
jgi:hypothetical protein